MLFMFQSQSINSQLPHKRPLTYPAPHNNPSGFVLVVCLIITLIVSLGSVALIRYSNSQAQMMNMSGFQILLRTEAESIANQVVNQLQGEKQLNGSAATDNATINQCNRLPNAVNSTRFCVAMPSADCTDSTADCHQLTRNSGSEKRTASGTHLFARKSIQLHYLGEVPAQGTADENHHLYRIDVTLKLNDWSVTQRRLVTLDRIGA